MFNMKARSILAVVLLAAGLQAAWAQKMVVTTTDDQVVEFDVSKIKDVTFNEEAGEHEWVDLGLPSETLWATCNVGANSPEQYGDYFAWGETEPKEDYSWGTYKWMNEGQSSWREINKYTFADGQTGACWYSNNQFIGDGKTELLPEDDAATANWGSDWQMPSLEQLQELYNERLTKTEWTTQGGVSGRLITSLRNGNSLFLPAAGYIYGTELYDAGSYAHYMSHSLHSDGSDDTSYLYFIEGYIYWSYDDRYVGRTVRPVRKK